MAASARRFRRNRLWLIAAVVLFVLSFLLTLRVSVTPSREIAHWVEGQLRAYGVGPKVEIREAWIEPQGLAVVLGGVRIGDDPKKPDVELAYVRVEFSFDWNDKVRVERVLVDKPVIRALALEKLIPKSLPQSSGGPIALPTLLIQHAIVRVESPEVGTLDFTDLHAVATPTGEDEVRVNGSVLTPLRGSMRVAGSVNLTTGRFELRGATGADVDLDTTTGATWSPTLEEWRAKLRPTGRIATQVSLLRGSAAEKLQFHVNIEANGLAATIPQIDVRPTEVKLRVTFDDSFEARVAAEGRLLGATLEARGSVRFEPGTLTFVRADAGARVRDLVLGPEIHRVMKLLDKGAAEVYAGLDPEGPVDVGVSLSKVAGVDKLDVAADLDLRGGAITFRGFPGPDDEIDASFPYRCTDLEGRISYRNERIWIAGARGHMGAGAFSAAGEVWGVGRVGIDLGVQAAGVELDERVAEAVPYLPGGADAWKLFDLAGKVGFDVSVTRPYGQTRAHVIVRVSSDGQVSGTYNDFPLLVEELAGAVTFDRGVATFAFDGICSSGNAHFEGLVDGANDASGKEPDRNGIRLRITAREFKLDRSIGNYFAEQAPGLKKFLDDLEPKSRVAFEYRGERPRNSLVSELEAVVALQSDGGVVRRVPRVDVQLEDVSASLRVFSKPRVGGDPSLRVLLDSIRGIYRGQTVRAVGTYSSQDARAPGAAEAVPVDSLEVTAAGIDLPFNKELILSMAKAGSSAAAEVVERYEFGGRFDLFLERRKTPLIDATDVQLELRQAAVVGPGIPGTFRECDGSLKVDGAGRLTSEVLLGKLDGTPVALEKFLLAPAPKPGDPVHIEGVLTSTESMDLVETVSKTHPAVRDWLQGVEFNAQVIPQAFAWELDIPEVGSPAFRSRSGAFVFSNGFALPDALVSKLEGRADLQELIYDGDGFRTTLTVRDGSYTAFGIPVEQFSGRVRVTPSTLVIDDVAGALGDGKLRSRVPSEPFLTVDMDRSPRPWSLSVDLAAARLEKIATGLGRGNSDLRGPLAANLFLRGEGATLRRLTGRGAIETHGARLADVPGTKPIFNKLEFEKAPVFTDLETQFSIDRGNITFDRLFMDSDPIALDGGGQAKLDGTVQLAFRPRPHSGLNPGEWFGVGWLLRPAVNLLLDLLAEVRYEGNIERPKVTVVRATTRRSELKQKQVLAPEPPLDLGPRF